MKYDRHKLSSYMKLYLVSDRSWLKDRSLSQNIEEALKGGVSFVQLREKELAQAAFIKEAKDIKALCAQYRVPFVINDDLDVALAVDADGIHVGQQDLAAKLVRERLGEEKILGVSVQTVAEALQAQRDGADYLGVGAVFSTRTKKDADAVSLQTLKAICDAVSIPVIAIGGIDKTNVLKLQDSGIQGVAVVSAIMASDDIYEASQELNDLCEVFVC